MPQKTLDTLPAEVSEGVYHRPALGRRRQPAFKLAAERLGIAEPDSYEAQATDWASLVILAIAKAKEATGAALKDNVRKISQGGGAEGLQRRRGPEGCSAEGKEINYEGASRPVRLHRDRRHPRLPVPLHEGGEGQAQVPEDRLT